MGEPLIDEFLAGDSKEIRELAKNEAVLVGFLTLAKGIDDLPEITNRFYEEPRSLYQATAIGCTIDELMKKLAEFFGAEVKSPGHNLPVNLRFDPVVKFLRGIRKDQVLYLNKLKTGTFYGALWPWQREPEKIEVLLGFCSTSMSEEDTNRMETLVQKFLSKKKLETVSGVGGQIHGISLPSFLQMSEMEGATYALKIASGQRTGFLHLADGSLIAAQCGNHTGNEAAYRIISWDNTSIQIEAADHDRVREIHDPLMHVLMESLKIKDEAGAETGDAPPVPEPEPASILEPEMELELAPEPAPEPELALELEPENGPEPEPELELELGPESEAESELALELDPEPETEPEPELKLELELETESKPDPQPVPEPPAQEQVSEPAPVEAALEEAIVETPASDAESADFVGDAIELSELEPKAPAGEKGPESSSSESRVATPFEKAEDSSMGRQRQMKRQTKLLIVLGVVIVFAVVVTFGGQLLKNRQLGRRYDQLVADLAVTKELDAQVVLLMQYLKAYPKDAHRKELEKRLDDTNAEIEKRDYEKTILDVNRLPIDEKYENRALSLYTAFLTKHPESSYAKPINEAIGGIRQLLGTASYENLKKGSPADFLERYAAYRDYLEKFPQGTERKEVEQLIQVLAQEYSQAIAERTAECDEKQNWDTCIAECDRFLSTFRTGDAVVQVNTLRSVLADKKALHELTAQTERMADDYAEAKRVFTDYLKANPKTSQKGEILKRIEALNVNLAGRAEWKRTADYASNPANDIFKRIQRLDAYIQNHPSGPYAKLANNLRTQLDPELEVAIRARRAEEKKRQELARKQAERARREKEAQRIRQLENKVAAQLRPVASRFVARQNGTVVDQVTGLTWCLLDSQAVLGKCVTYQAARAYVQGLTSGGHSDWRLPTAGELATLYKNSPYFPATGAVWYWTSESFARGYHRVVDVVTSMPEAVFTRIQKTEDKCGAVRAVRK